MLNLRRILRKSSQQGQVSANRAPVKPQTLFHFSFICTEGLSKTVLLTLKEQPDGSKKWVVRQTLTGHRFGPITSFKITNSNGQVNCLLVVDYGSTDSEEQAQGFVYSFNDTASTQSVAMTLLQQIPLERPSQVRRLFFQLHSELLISFSF